MKIKKVLKYSTGDIIPEEAKYLCTKTEKVNLYINVEEAKGKCLFKKNLLVWHYFLVEIEV